MNQYEAFMETMLFKQENHTDILVKRLETGIETAKGIDGDFVYITVGEAKRMLRIIKELEEYKKREAEDKNADMP